MISQDRLFADGLDLLPTSGWCHAEDLSSAMAGPALLGDGVVVARSHGTKRPSARYYGSNEFEIPIWVYGIDPVTGLLPSDGGHRQLHLNIDRIKRVFARPGLRLLHSWAGQGARVAVLDPAADTVTVVRQRSSPPTARLVIPVRTAGDPFWADEDPVTQEFSGPTGTIVDLTAFAGATAPIADLQIVLPGPVSNPLLVHGRRTQQWNGVIPAGRQLLVATASWTVSAGTGAAWSPDFRQLTWSGGGLLELDPRLDPFALEFHHTGGGSAGGFITARRKYFNP
ncbi:hypothetical protein DMP17_22210 [Pseudonocardia sp. TMWB2A]|uniref:hypothetical protein n=1 Tax=Pseudonocardia sp. TMWB2A TaxID=687430 RepID=UPI00307DC38B